MPPPRGSINPLEGPFKTNIFFFMTLLLLGPTSYSRNRGLCFPFILHSVATCIMFKLMPHLVFVDSPELSAHSLVHLASQKAEWLAGRYAYVTWDLLELYSKDEIIQREMLKVRFVV
jgi:hypothetical protein